MGEQLNPRDIDEIIRDVDLNGDGQVDFEGQVVYKKGIKSYKYFVNSVIVFQEFRKNKWQTPGCQIVYSNYPVQFHLSKRSCIPSAF